MYGRFPHAAKHNEVEHAASLFHISIQEMEDNAARLGADAVVGVDIDYEVLGADNGMLMVTACGTAVRIE